MKRTAAWILGAAAWGMALSLPPAQAGTPPLLETTFEKDAGDWQALSPTGDTTARISITHDASHLKEGKGALQYDYTIKKGVMNALALPVTPGTLTKMKTLHFWVQADHASSLVLVLSEKGGGRYQTPIAVAPNTWQEVTVAPSDLLLSEDPGSPPDPDGKLDLDQVDGISLADTDAFLAQIPGDPVPFEVATGPHTLYLSHFEVTEAPLPAIPGAVGEVQFNPFLRPQFNWLVIGDMSVQKVTEKPLSGPSMKVAYTQKKMKVFGMLQQIPTGSLASAKQVSFAVAAKHPVTLIVQVETKNNLKFKTQIEVPGDSELKEFTLPFADFQASDDSADKSAPLDLKQINKFLLLDVTGFALGDEQENTLWINKLHTSSK